MSDANARNESYPDMAARVSDWEISGRTRGVVLDLLLEDGGRVPVMLTPAQAAGIGTQLNQAVRIAETATPSQVAGATLSGIKEVLGEVRD
jgi:hypothetical protein